jgi:hypothetical protein
MKTFLHLLLICCAALLPACSSTPAGKPQVVGDGSWAAHPLVHIEYAHSMRRSHQRVSLTIRENGNIASNIKDDSGPERTHSWQLEPSETARLRGLIAAVNWEAAAKDTTIGCDGTMVSVTAGGKSASLWTPELDQRKRGLTELNKLVTASFALAGLDPDGLPKR